MNVFELGLFYVTTARDRYVEFGDENYPAFGGGSPKGMKVIDDPVRPHPHNRPGHTYVMRPDLTRPGFPIVAGRAGVALAGPAAMFLTYPMLYQANEFVIERAPEEQQAGMWQMFSSALTGTFGIGSGLNL